MNQLAEMVIFARVVEAKGFSAAARQLGMTTSAVSRSVARLEGHIGGRLLHRSTRSVSVTELGAEIYSGCARIAQTAREVEAFAGRYASAPSGRLKVSVPVTYGQLRVAPLLSEFLSLWPEVDVQLDLTDNLVDVVADAVDVAVRIAHSIPLGLVARPLGWIDTVLVASPAYLTKAPAPKSPADLAQHPLVFEGQDSALSFSRASARASVCIESRLRINHGASILAIVAEGFGIGLVPDFAAREAIDRGQLVQVLDDWSLQGAHGARPVQAIFSPTRHMPRKVRAFIDFMVAKSRSETGARPLLQRAA